MSDNFFHRILALGLALATGIPLSAAAASSVPLALHDCRALADADRRLRCYDDITDALGLSPASPSLGAGGDDRQSGLNSAGAASIPAPDGVGGARTDDHFGRESLPLPQPEAVPRRLTARALIRVDGVARGLRVPLDNGQIWMCVDDRRYDFELDHPEVVVERGLFGHYWMAPADAAFRFRVRRIQ